ncbi:GNAT family N-acetyltransferase [Paenibacillus sp. UNC451MF]|uniref:GNAT family N-acetyltransferase n=1 Tax=Paenibacillus sp. UNC451MF TaxID=1449063 RepID=UPI00048E8DD8|nr:GNAT family N-acetyltransferase [Paenibacillus sp. UNC451MF]
MIAFVSGSDLSAIRELLDELPDRIPMVFKVQREDYKKLIKSGFQLKRMRSFYTYSCFESIPITEINEIIEETELNNSLLPLWSNNGYDPQQLNQMFELGARSYTLYKAGEPVSTCLTFYNYAKVWEIGAVYTPEEHRGKGYAKKVVATAVNRLLEKELLPRYQVLDSNLSSIKVAESLGLSRVVTLEHLYYDGS